MRAFSSRSLLALSDAGLGLLVHQSVLTIQCVPQFWNPCAEWGKILTWVREDSQALTYEIHHVFTMSEAFVPTQWLCFNKCTLPAVVYCRIVPSWYEFTDKYAFHSRNCPVQQNFQHFGLCSVRSKLTLTIGRTRRDLWWELIATLQRIAIRLRKDTLFWGLESGLHNH